LNTFFLMMVVLSFTQKESIPKCAFGGAIGLVLTCLICGSGPLTGCAANPFRALGPCVFDGNWADLAIYLTFPFLGGLFATILYKLLLEDDEAPKDDKRNNTLIDVQGEFEVDAE
jgi:aquaporin NIP